MSDRKRPAPPAARVRPSASPAPLASLAFVAAVVSFVLSFVLPVLAAAPAQAAAAWADEPRPAVTLSLQEAATGTGITVTGTGWRARTTVTLLVCGQNMAGGTSSCANAAGAVVAVAAGGHFTARLSVAAPPEPCPCVVSATSVDGDRSTVAVPLTIPGHPVAAPPSPAASAAPRLVVLTGVRLTGGDTVLTWFGARPGRTLRVTVGNLGPAPVTDPVFRLATAHGVFAPSWEETRWKGTIAPGGRAGIALPVGLAAGAHGAHRVSLTYDGTVLATRLWAVDRPYGVLLFQALLLLVVPVAVFRTGMAAVDRVRPPRPPESPPPPRTPRTPRTPAPSENRPTTKGPS